MSGDEPQKVYSEVLSSRSRKSLQLFRAHHDFLDKAKNKKFAMANFQKKRGWRLEAIKTATIFPKLVARCWVVDSWLSDRAHHMKCVLRPFVYVEPYLCC